MTSAKELAVSVLGSRLVSGTVRTLLRGRLRVLAYHGVSDPERFRQHLGFLAHDYRVVSGVDVVGAVRDGRELPERAVWITFDDGHASVVESGLPLLIEHNLKATMFVCPGVIESGETHWWDLIESAARSGWTCEALPRNRYVAAMKSLPDRDRRRLVADASQYVGRAGTVHGDSTAVASRHQLESWTNAGMELGNHTWDHPCLDRCDPEEQQRQICEADRWLDEFGALDRCRLFAYPNGDWSPDGEKALQELGYDAGLLFDHRLTRIDTMNPLQISRLRLDTSAPIHRTRAILSGGHPLVYRPTSLVSTNAGPSE